MPKSKKRHQRQLEWARARQHRREPGDPVTALEKRAEADGLRLISYGITAEPLVDQFQSGQPLENVLDEDERNALYQQAQRDPESAIPRLRQLLSDHPDCPPLYNWLATALEGAGRIEETYALAEENFRRHPDYIFAVVNLAMLMLDRGEIEQCTALLDKRFELKLLRPDRDVFHITEFRSFYYLMVVYFTKMNEPLHAKRYFSVLERTDPDCWETDSARRIIDHSTLTGLMKRAMQRMLRIGLRR
jgi:tetratricopeptide (TPR) repeat protein